MAQRRQPIDHFWGPFRSDCEELLGRFQQTDSVRFEEFSAIWRDMDFASVFFGTPTDHRKKSFTRLAFTVAHSYILPPYSFQIRVGGLYLIYGLYNKQLAWPKEKVRIALKDWYELQKLITDAKTCQHLDIVYIFNQLLFAKAFYFTAMPKKLTFEAKERVQHDVNEEFRDRTDKVAELVSTEMLEEIANVHSLYENMKKSSVPTSSGVTLLNLPDLLQKCTHEYRQWQDKAAMKREKEKGIKEGADQKSESSSRAGMLAAIKSKSYSNASKARKSRRHRQVEMVTPDSETDQDPFGPKKKLPSLRARTCKSLCLPGETETQAWLLSVMEEDKYALKRKDNKRFKW